MQWVHQVGEPQSADEVRPTLLRRKCVRSRIGLANSRSICSRRFFSLSALKASSASAREIFFLAEGLLKDIDHCPIPRPVSRSLTGDDIRQCGNYYGFAFYSAGFGPAAQRIE
jgi:hypothetical protein